MLKDCAQAARIVGRSVLFIGGEVKSQNWQLADIVGAAKRARAVGFDSICVKVGEGTEAWFSPAECKQIHDACNSQAQAGFIPMWYSIGPRFGLGFVDAESALMKQYIEAVGFLCDDKEVEWDNQPVAAARYAANMAGVEGALFLTTWADPLQQGWPQVMRNLDPVVTAVIPQQYNDWLAAQQAQLNGVGCIMPAVDLSQEFGVNHPISIAQAALARGEQTCWAWEWGYAMGAYRAEAQGVTSVMRRATRPIPTPAPTPTPAPVPAAAYHIVSGDTLSAIADHLGKPEPALFAENKTHLDATARHYGYADSNNGNLIFPGDTITY